MKGDPVSGDSESIDVDIDDPVTGSLANVILCASGQRGLTATTVDGRPASLAVVDLDGRVIESGPAVGDEAWNVVVHAYRLFLQGQGYLKVYATPEGMRQDALRGE
ncbi:hypothetical protein AAB992_14175 [Burkholderia contaminans]|uniref:hypothetical protein n=1 Tax=Burkholderia contaminans TaxID=488447 RepID=UPI0024174143|nr:hypothetical protein [Burkholderia contaminans]WFN14379.1 hypothetical protein LXE92_36340 [Burkholderia contaminans]